MFHKSLCAREHEFDVLMKSGETKMKKKIKYEEIQMEMDGNRDGDRQKKREIDRNGRRGGKGNGITNNPMWKLMFSLVTIYMRIALNRKFCVCVCAFKLN